MSVVSEPMTNARGYTYVLVDDRVVLFKTKLGKLVKHGGKGSAYSLGCRCEECGLANADRQDRANIERRERREAGYTGFKHGRSGYTNWGCPCDVCVAAGAEANAKYYNEVLKG